MNPFRLIIMLIIIIGIASGTAGKFMIVTGYDFGIKVVPKSNFYIMPFFLNLHNVFGDIDELSPEVIKAGIAKFPKAAPDIKKYTDELNNFVICRNNLYIIQQAVNKYLDKNVYNTVKEGPVDWKKIYEFLPNYQEKSCPDGGSYYIYKENNEYKVGCTSHRTIDNPRIGF